MGKSVWISGTSGHLDIWLPSIPQYPLSVQDIALFVKW